MKQFHFTPLRILLVGFLLGTGVVAVVLGTKYTHRKKLHALFVGPSEVMAGVSDRGYYPRLAYDLRAYVSDVEEYLSSETETEIPFPAKPKRQDIEWVEGLTREQLEAMRRERRVVDATTGATPGEDRLRWREVYQERVPSRVLRISYPPDGAVFPPNLCEPSVEWDDGGNGLWQITVGVSGTSLRWSFVTAQRWWWFPSDIWRIVRKKAVEHEAWIQVKGIQRVDAHRKGAAVIQVSPPVHFRFSEHPVDHYVVYRLVSPQFQAQKTPDTFIRDLRSFRVKMFLSARQRYCFSCHTFSSKTGTEGMMSIKMRFTAGKEKPSGLGVVDMASGKGWKVQFPFAHKGFTYMGWNAEGDKLVVSANQAFTSSRPLIHETQELEYSASDIAVYDLAQDRVALLPGASSPDYLEIYPSWTPEGRRIVFSRVKARVSARIMQFDLYVVDYNDGEGGTPVAVEGASQNGKSNYYARYAPDGKWMSFCMADQGSLVESSSDLYVLPGDLRGPAHRLACNAAYAADSWHSWSSNSRWLVFASKRDDGIYARLYLTQIDEEGYASPAVRVPVKDSPLESFNLPEFLAGMPQMGEPQLFEVVRAEAPTITLQSGALR